MLRQPNEHWLRAVLVATDASATELKELAVGYGFHPPSNEYYKYLVESIKDGRPSAIDLRSAETQLYLRRQRLTSAVRRDSDFEMACSALMNGRVRKVLEHLLLSEAPVEEIPEYLKSITGARMEARAVRVYAHFFWNRSILSDAEWDRYLSNAGHEDRSTLIGGIVHGYEYALWQLGYRVEVPTPDAMRMIMNEGLMRFMETKNMKNGKDTALTAKLWSEQVHQASTALSAGGDGLGQVLDKLRAISIKLETNDTPGVDTINTSKTKS